MWHTKPRIYTLAYTYARGVKTRRREEDPRRIAVGARGKKSGCQGSVIQNFRCTLGLSSPLAASHFQLTWKERVCPSSWAAYTRPRQCKDVLLRLAGSFFLAERRPPPYLRPWRKKPPLSGDRDVSVFASAVYPFCGSRDTMETVTISCRYCYRVFELAFERGDQQNFRLSPGLRNWLALVVFGFMRATVCHFPSILSEGFECFQFFPLLWS